MLNKQAILNKATELRQNHQQKIQTILQDALAYHIAARSDMVFDWGRFLFPAWESFLSTEEVKKLVLCLLDEGGFFAADTGPFVVVFMTQEELDLYLSHKSKLDTEEERTV